MVVVTASTELPGLLPQEAASALFGGEAATRAFHLEMDGEHPLSVTPWRARRREVRFEMPLSAPDVIKRLVGVDTLCVVERQEVLEAGEGLVRLSSAPELQAPGGQRFRTAVCFALARQGSGCKVDATITCTAAGPWGLVSTIEAFMAAQARASIDQYLAFCGRWCEQWRLEQAGAPVALASFLVEGLAAEPGEGLPELAAAPSRAPSETASWQDLFFDASEGASLDAHQWQLVSQRLQGLEQQAGQLLGELRAFRGAIQPANGEANRPGSAPAASSASPYLLWLSGVALGCGATAALALLLTQRQAQLRAGGAGLRGAV